MSDPGRPPTPFEERVYQAARRIPRGRVTTYQALARELGAGSPRSVGQALRKNPFAPEVPCHRVVRSDRQLGGFSGHTEGAPIARKRRLLLSEGVRFDSGGAVAPECLFTFEP